MPAAARLLHFYLPAPGLMEQLLAAAATFGLAAAVCLPAAAAAAAFWGDCAFVGHGHDCVCHAHLGACCSQKQWLQSLSGWLRGWFAAVVRPHWAYGLPGGWQIAAPAERGGLVQVGDCNNTCQPADGVQGECIAEDRESKMAGLCCVLR